MYSLYLDIMDEAVATVSQGSGDLPNPPSSSLGDRPKSKKQRKPKSASEGTPVKAPVAARDPSTGKFISSFGINPRYTY